MRNAVVAIGTGNEVAHHVRPLQDLHAIRCLEPDAAVAELRPGDLAVFYSEHFERFRRCVGELRQRQVATLYLVDGILEWRNAWENRPDEPACPWTMRPVLSHKVACIGLSQARTLAAWGNADRIEITGIPRMDRLTGLQPVDPLPDRLRILVATAKFPGFTPQQTALTLDSLRDLKQAFENNPVIGGKKAAIVWRVAPQLAAELAVDNALTDLSGGEIARQICGADAVITTASTTLLEAMRLGRPTALLDYHNCPQYVPAAWRISASSQILPTLRGLAEPAAARLDLQAQILADSLQSAEPAAERTGLLISRMLDHAARCIAENRPLEFPPQLLPPPAAIHGTFSHASLYPLQADFVRTDQIEMVSELAHARREIRHLESVIAGLRGELQQAHGIFEQIRRHPVAGPIVRIREKFLRLAGNWRNASPDPAAPARPSPERGDP